jgi:hypothetical protein
MWGQTWKASTAAAIAGAAILVASQAAHPTGQTFQPPTFYKEVLPILQKNCQSCHRPGQIAPFSLLTYESTRPWARSIRTKVESRQMPPWFADAHVSEFSNNPSLTDGQIETIVKWVDGGAPAGDVTDAPPPVQWAENGWTVKPDHIIKGMEYPVPAHTPKDVIEWATYYVPTGLTQDTWVTSLEIKPSELSVTHHICVTFVEHNPAVKYNDLLWVDRRRDEAGVDLEDNGINNLEPPGSPRPRFVTSGGNNDGCYVPGKSFEDYRIFDAAKLVPANSDMRFQIHYTPAGKDRVDRPEVGLTIAKEPPRRTYITAGISAPGNRKVFAIPPNDPNWSSPPAQATFTADAELVWMMPHMHVRGKDMTYVLEYPDGRKETILSVPRYDFNWQLGYNLAKPIKVPKGTKMTVYAHFDNSASNKFNPDPNRTVYMGTMTWEEMMFPFFSVVVDKGVDPRKVISTRVATPDGA